MNDEQNNNQGNSIQSSNDVPVNSCPNCQKNPCICSANSNDSPQKTLGQKTRVKGSHRKGNPPKLKWI